MEEGENSSTEELGMENKKEKVKLENDQSIL